MGPELAFVGIILLAVTIAGLAMLTSHSPEEVGAACGEEQPAITAVHDATLDAEAATGVSDPFFQSTFLHNDFRPSGRDL